MRLISSWIIPRLKIVSAGNSSQSHWQRGARNKVQKQNVKAYFLKERPQIELPCIIRLTRIAPRKLDEHDNLPYSMKWIVDSLADCIFPGQRAGRADDSKEIKWVYSQEKGNPKEYGLKVEIMVDD